MSTEIHNQNAGLNLANAFTKNIDHPVQERPAKPLPTPPPPKEVIKPSDNLKNLHEDIQKIVADLRQVSHAFNRRLDFEMNEQLGQVIVRIINSDTGEVIKVLPPEELQKLHMKIKETVGLLIDEKI